MRQRTSIKIFVVKKKSAAALWSMRSGSSVVTSKESSFQICPMLLEWGSRSSREWEDERRFVPSTVNRITLEWSTLQRRELKANDVSTGRSGNNQAIVRSKR